MKAAFFHQVSFADVSGQGDVMLWKLIGTAAVVVLLAGAIRWLIIKGKQR